MVRSLLKGKLNDIVTLVKKDGTVAKENIQALVQPKTIFMDDKTLPIEPEDRLLRKLPSGLVEEFIVVEPGFFSEARMMPAHFQTKVRRGSEPTAQATIINNIQGQNARVNIHSTDNSINSASKTEKNEILTHLSERLDNSSIPTNEADRLRDAIIEMKAAESETSFKSAYVNFMALAANHAAVFGPILGALAKLL